MDQRGIRIALDKLLRERNISRYELARRTNVKYQTIDNYYKNRVVRYDSILLLKFCRALGCSIGDIIEITQKDPGRPT